MSTLAAQFPKAGVKTLEYLIINSARAGRPLLIIGRTGIGKTAICGQAAKRLGKRLVDFDLGNGAREDAMLTTKVTDPTTGEVYVVRVPLDALREACKEGVVLFIDEVTRADRNKQAIAMALANERRIGSFRLHPDTVVIMAGNDLTSQGTFTLNDALVNRCCTVVFEPSRDDSRGYLATLGLVTETEVLPAPAKPGPNFTRILNTLAVKYTAVCGARDGMLVPMPPEGTTGQHASPRAVEHGLTRLAAYLSVGGSFDEHAQVEFSGVVGSGACAAWAAILASEDKVPTPESIVANPHTAMLPPDVESAVAALGAITLAVMKDANATWLYLDHFSQKWPEACGVACRDLLSKPAPTTPAATKARATILGRLQRATDRAR